MLSCRILIFLALVFELVGCSRETGLTVANHSSGVITNIIVSGSGFSERIDRLAAGAEHRLAVHPRGESGARVAFDAGGRHIDIGEQGYFVNFPSKFISQDGKTAWLCYAANFSNPGWKTDHKSDPPGSGYGMTLQEVELITTR